MNPRERQLAPRRNIDAVSDLGQARYELERFLLGGGFSLRENGDPLAGPDGIGGASAEASYGKLILSCWSEGWSRSWRVVECQAGPKSVRLVCTSQMRRLQSILELTRGPVLHETAGSREGFFRELPSLLAHISPRLSIVRFDPPSAGVPSLPPREDASIPRRGKKSEKAPGVPNYLRMVLLDAGNRGTRIAAIAVPPSETQPVVDSVLMAGIVWAEEVRARDGRVDRIMLLVPAGRSATIASRLTLIRHGAELPAMALYECDPGAPRIEFIGASDQGDLHDRMKRGAGRSYWPSPRGLSGAAARLSGPLIQLAPDFVDVSERGPFVHLSIRGLEFARVHVPRERIEFGLSVPGPAAEGSLPLNHRKVLTGGTWLELERLVSRILAARSPLSSDFTGDLYRGQAERWLESVVRRSATVIDPTIDPRYVYSQVPMYRGEHRTFIDVLAATRGGRLAIMELKVAEDPDFPIQALDYWLRVDWHRRRGDFKRRGYFGDLELADEPPLLYLVAPLFRFHRTTALISRYISSEVPVYRIGVNDGWRSRLRVLMRERLN